LRTGLGGRKKKSNPRGKETEVMPREQLAAFVEERGRGGTVQGKSLGGKHAFGSSVPNKVLDGGRVRGRWDHVNFWG